MHSNELFGICWRVFPRKDGLAVPGCPECATASQSPVPVLICHHSDEARRAHNAAGWIFSPCELTPFSSFFSYQYDPSFVNTCGFAPSLWQGGRYFRSFVSPKYLFKAPWVTCLSSSSCSTSARWVLFPTCLPRDSSVSLTHCQRDTRI